MNDEAVLVSDINKKLHKFYDEAYGKNHILVYYAGMLPDLFREGQGVICEGKIGKNGIFRANKILAKHDEKYMPPEVADALKKTGKWKGVEEKK